MDARRFHAVPLTIAISLMIQDHPQLSSELIGLDVSKGGEQRYILPPETASLLISGAIVYLSLDHAIERHVRSDPIARWAAAYLKASDQKQEPRRKKSP